jgi:hypothetical protein
VKDLRTGVTSTAPGDVLDGDLDRFLLSALAAALSAVALTAAALRAAASSALSAAAFSAAALILSAAALTAAALSADVLRRVGTLALLLVDLLDTIVSFTKYPSLLLLDSGSLNFPWRFLSPLRHGSVAKFSFCINNMFSQIFLMPFSFFCHSKFKNLGFSMGFWFTHNRN